MPQDIEEIIERFTSSEAALRRIVEASGELESARVELEKAEKSLDRLDHHVAETASLVFSVANELKAIARDMRDTMIAVQSLKPELVHEKLDGLTVGVNDAVKKSGRAVEAAKTGFESTEGSLLELRKVANMNRILLVIVTLLTIGVGVVAAVH